MYNNHHEYIKYLHERCPHTYTRIHKLYSFLPRKPEKVQTSFIYLFWKISQSLSLSLWWWTPASKTKLLIMYAGGCLGLLYPSPHGGQKRQKKDLEKNITKSRDLPQFCSPTSYHYDAGAAERTISPSQLLDYTCQFVCCQVVLRVLQNKIRENRKN